MSTLHEIVRFFRPDARSEDCIIGDETDSLPSSNTTCGLSWNTLHLQRSPACSLNITSDVEYNEKGIQESPTEVHKANEFIETFEPPEIQRRILPLDLLSIEKHNVDALCFDTGDDDQALQLRKFFPKPVTFLNEGYRDPDIKSRTVHHDDSTVVVSNRVVTDRTHDKECTFVQKHCSLKHVFHINLSASLELPKCNPNGSMNALIRQRFCRSRYSMGDSTRSMNAISGNRSPRISIPKWLSVNGSVKRPILKKEEEKMLIGTSLSGCRSQRSSAVKNFFQRIRKDFTSNPRDKFETLLRGQNLCASKQIYTNRQKHLFKRRSLASSQERPFAHHDSWELDDAVKGRFDGIDVLCVGSAKKVIRTTSNQRHLAFRKIVQESLWSSCARKPSVIIFEGLTSAGKGSDRWSATINKVDNYSVYGKKELLLNPDCSSICVDGQQNENSSISVNSFEDIQQSYNIAVEPLIFGDIQRSIIIMKKISLLLQKAFKDPDKAHHIIGSTHHNIASLYLLDGNFDQALIHINKAISTRIRSLGFDHESVAVSLAKLGLVYIGLDRLSDALDALQQALKMRIINDKLYQLDVAKLFNNIGVVLYLQKCEKKAIGHFAKAMRIQNYYMHSSLCRDCIKYDNVVSLSNMAKTYLNRKNHQMSAFLYEEALEYQLSILDKDHVDVLEMLDNIAFVKLDSGDQTNAMNIYKILHKLQVAKFGSGSYQAVGTLCMMSFIMIQISNYTVALRYLTEVLHWQLQTLDLNDVRVKNTQSIIASLQNIIQDGLH